MATEATGIRPTSDPHAGDVIARHAGFVRDLVSVATRRTKSDEELKGLVYSLTARPKQEAVAWYKRPLELGIVVLVLAVVLNVIFW